MKYFIAILVLVCVGCHDVYDFDPEYDTDTEIEIAQDSETVDSNFVDIDSDTYTIIESSKSCCELSSEPGCDSLKIQGCVCSKDEWCCRIKWDGFCIDLATECGGC